ncbi:hypothetical protein SmJEL517_g06140 [Synchytrium microbalum]|uniref:COP9 signalosome complex subunit 3 n=1 Tax=Synchytrium microbalum TaxID=1806994 RepID=A0A507BSB5_9FUNG|nr:uncharacterized protein SmJEL517_g06140 [Synchytrium microbalum]TPX30261.1 hypothetical protein SmJEL517_g06140 [Synchytrium microbalum]
MAGTAANPNTTNNNNNNDNAGTAAATTTGQQHGPTADELIGQLITAPFITGREATKNLLPFLKGLGSQQLLAFMADGRDPLSILDPSQCTLGYFYILTARLHHHNDNNHAELAALLAHTTHFASTFSLEQLPSSPALVLAPLIQTMVRATPRGPPASVQIYMVSCLMALKVFTMRLSQGGLFLTSVAVIFLRWCILTRHYKYAWDVVAHDISEVDPKEFDVKVQDFLLHHYYGAMICIGLKKFDRAIEMLHLCIATPASVTSAIQIEAYRKFILVSYIQHGKILPIPKYTAAPVARATKSYSASYADFATALESNNRQRVVTELSKSQDVFNKQHNLGLAKQALTALTRKSIAQLTQTYLTLSLADIARLVGIEGPNAVLEAEHHVVCMIEEGQILATISHTAGGMVSFHDQMDAFDDARTAEKLDFAIRNAHDATKDVSRMDRMVAISKEYLNKIVHGDRSGGGGSTTTPTSSTARSESAGLGGGLLDDDLYDDPR